MKEGEHVEEGEGVKEGESVKEGECEVVRSLHVPGRRSFL